MTKTIDEFIHIKSEKELEGKVVLSKDLIIELQNRFKHYLNSFETENRMNATEVAKILGYTSMHYSRFKLVGSLNKVASVFLFLANFAQLKKMSLSEFIIYIENKPIASSEDQILRGLYEWELELLKCANSLESTVRRFFTRRAVKDTLTNKLHHRLEIGLMVATLMTYFKLDDLKLLVSVVKELAKRIDYNAPVQQDDNISRELKDLRNELAKYLKNAFAAPEQESGII